MKVRLPQGMGGGPQNMNQMIKQAQKMQEQITAVQEDIEGRTFNATAGGGMVEVEMTGKKILTSVKIKPEVVNPDDIEMLEDLVMSAVNECVKSIEETSEKEMGAVTGGVSLPGIL